MTFSRYFRPFPTALNIGIDVTSIARFRPYALTDHATRTKGALKPPKTVPSIDLGNGEASSAQLSVNNTATPTINTDGSETQVEQLPTRDVTLEQIPTGKIEPSQALARFLDRMFTSWELKGFLRKMDSWKVESDGEESCARYLAGRWAAKEAVIKAYAPQRRLFLRDVEIVPQTRLPPIAIVLDERFPPKGAASAVKPAREAKYGSPNGDRGGDVDRAQKATTKRGQMVQVSISHDGDICTAVALASLQEPDVTVAGQRQPQGSAERPSPRSKRTPPPSAPLRGPDVEAANQQPSKGATERLLPQTKQTPRASASRPGPDQT